MKRNLASQVHQVHRTSSSPRYQTYSRQASGREDACTSAVELRRFVPYSISPRTSEVEAQHGTANLVADGSSNTAKSLAISHV